MIGKKWSTSTSADPQEPMDSPGAKASTSRRVTRMGRPPKAKNRRVDVLEDLWLRVEARAATLQIPPEALMTTFLVTGLQGNAAPIGAVEVKTPKPEADKPWRAVDPTKVATATSHSGYVGVYVHGNRWKALYRSKLVGTYDTALEAAQARYLADQAYEEEQADAQREAAEREAQRDAELPLSEGVERAAITSGYRGVYPHGTRWKATYKNQLVGIFDTALKAAEARLPFIRTAEIAAEEQAREAQEERDRETAEIIKQTADEIRARLGTGTPHTVRGKDAPVPRGPSREPTKPKVEEPLAELPKATVKPTMVTPPRRPRIAQTPPPTGSRPAASADDGLGVVLDEEETEDEDIAGTTGGIVVEDKAS